MIIFRAMDERGHHPLEIVHFVVEKVKNMLMRKYPMS